MTGAKRRVGIYCPGVGTGGPWRYVHSLLAGLDLDEFDVSVFCDLSGRYDPRPEVKVVRLPQPAPPTPSPPPTSGTGPPAPRRRRLPAVVPLWAGFAAEARRLARVIRANPVDVFHTQNTGCEESPVAARLAGVRRVVGTFHVDSTYDLHGERSTPRYRVLEMLSNRCLDAGIAVAEATRRDWLRRTHMLADRVVTVHNGIDPARFRRRRDRETARRELGLPADRLTVVGLGRLDEAKGFGDLISAAGLLWDTVPRLQVAIAGDGPLRQALEKQIETAGLAKVVRLLGFRSDVQAVLDAADVFALPSWCEALPYAVLEAMATELPVIGADVGGVVEMVRDGETGLVVPPRKPAELAAAVRTLAADAELRARMGTAGRRRVKTAFDERDMVRRTAAVYQGADAVARRAAEGSTRGGSRRT